MLEQFILTKNIIKNFLFNKCAVLFSFKFITVLFHIYVHIFSKQTTVTLTTYLSKYTYLCIIHLLFITKLEPISQTQFT